MVPFMLFENMYLGFTWMTIFFFNYFTAQEKIEFEGRMKDIIE